MGNPIRAHAACLISRNALSTQPPHAVQTWRAVRKVTQLCVLTAHKMLPCDTRLCREVVPRKRTGPPVSPGEANCLNKERQ